MNAGHNGGPPLREGNWIAISRDVIEHHIVGAGQPVPAADKNRGAFSRLEAWLDLLCMANFRERQFDVRGITITLKPGETLAGRAHLSERWNWSEKTVRNFLEKLEREMMISLAVASLKASENQLAQVSTRSQPGQKTGQLSGRFPNVLSVCNWTKYQLEPMAHEPVKGPDEGQLGASWGPYLNKETIKQTKDHSLRAGEENLGHGVFANCETIRHPAFHISLKAIELQLVGTVPMAEIKAVALGHALQWALDIEAGKDPAKVLPTGNMASFIRKSIQNQRSDAAVTEVRKTRAATPAPRRVAPDGRAESEWERMSRLMGEPSRTENEIEIIPPTRQR